MFTLRQHKMMRDYSPDMTGAPRADADSTALSVRFRRAFHGLRTEGTGPGREAAAIGVGVFIGCLPFYGFHLLLCWVVGSLAGLNRLKVYLAANISNPLVAPWLLFIELQVGAWLRHGRLQSITIAAIKETGAVTFGTDLLAGSVSVGAVLAAAAAGATYVTVRSSPDDAWFIELVRRASDRYVGTSVTAWEFARGKLRGDPLYRTTLMGGLLPSGGSLVDVGCGQGLTLALFAEASAAVDNHTWPALEPKPPIFNRLIGIEIRARAAALARQALKDAAEVIEGDARSVPALRAHAVLVFDVLHMINPEDQETLLASLVKALEPGGVLLVREADRAAGWRFAMVRIGNRLKALVFGAWKQEFHFRSRAEWLDLFQRHGLRADVKGAAEGTPFANLLFRLTRALDASASTHPAGPVV
jgi:uncharacterized protein (DUF2062 family)/2-polyprenyl-3-methyl-5-hydroxy-6-metoxy-1,4-benzoquinol methylase